MYIYIYMYICVYIYIYIYIYIYMYIGVTYMPLDRGILIEKHDIFPFCMVQMSYSLIKKRLKIFCNFNIVKIIKMGRTATQYTNIKTLEISRMKN